MIDRLPGSLLRLEGLAVAGAALVLHVRGDYGWLALVLLALAPDLSFLGYLAGPRVGALAYDVVHTYVGPVALGVAGVLGDSGLAVQLALIWLAHTLRQIGFDQLALNRPAS